MGGLCSEGNQLKFWEDDFLVKLDTAGCESVGEVLASTVQSCIINRFPYVDYKFCVRGSRLGCRCRSFLRGGESVISLKSVLDSSECFKIDYSMEGIDLKNAIVGILQMENSIWLEPYLGYMIYLDALLLNCDRHLRNISFIQSRNDLRVSPLYDFGDSLLCSPGRKVYKAQPFSYDFSEQVKLFDREPLLIDYNRLNYILRDAESNPNMYIVSFGETCLVENIRFLKLRLSETEGWLWKRS